MPHNKELFPKLHTVHVTQIYLIYLTRPLYEYWYIWVLVCYIIM